MAQRRTPQASAGSSPTPWQTTRAPAPPASRRFVAPPPLRQASSGGESASLRGFGNFGNTCYMNSVLVCLMALPPFLRCLLCNSAQQPLHAAPYAKVPLSTELSKLLLAQLAQQMLASRRSGTGAPTAQRAELVKARLSAACDRFQGYQQQDAHEFLIALLAQLDTELAPLGRRMAETAGILRAAYMPSDPDVYAAHVLLRGSALEEGGKPYPLSVPGAVLSDSRSSRAAARAAVNPIRRAFVFHTCTSMTCESCGYTRSRMSEHVCLSLTLSAPNAAATPAAAEATAALTPVAESNQATDAVSTGLVQDVDSDGDMDMHAVPGGQGGVSAASSLQLDTPVAAQGTPGPTAGDTSFSSFDAIATPQPGAAAPDLKRQAAGSPAAAPVNSKADEDSMLPLTALLDAYFAPERLEFRCEECPEGKHVRSKPSVAALPRVLIIQLNRFATNPFTGDTQKVHTPVPFPLELSLEDHCVIGALPGTELQGAAVKQNPPPVVVMAPPPLDALDNAADGIEQRVQQASSDVHSSTQGAAAAATPRSAPAATSAAGRVRGTFAAPNRSAATRRSTPALHTGSHHSGASLDTLRAHVAGGGVTASTPQKQAEHTPDAQTAFKSISSSDSSAPNSGSVALQPASGQDETNPDIADVWQLMGQPAAPHTSSRINSIPSRTSSASDLIARKKRAREEEAARAQQRDSASRGWGRGHSQADTALRLDASIADDSPVQNLTGAFQRAGKASRRGGLKGGEGGDDIIDLSEQSTLATPAAPEGSADNHTSPDHASVTPSIASSNDAGDDEEASPAAACVRGVPLVGANPKYQLQAVICHQGSGNAQGHYTCLARGLRNGRMQWGAQAWEEALGWGHVPGAEAAAATAEARADVDAGRKDNTNAGCGGEQWWLYNDSSVQRVSEQAVLGDATMRSAYVLAYVLKQPYS